MSLRLTAVLTVLLTPLALWAQPLADRVPDDAVLYVGWQGASSMPPGYQQSHLKAVLDASNLPAVFESVIPGLIQRVAAEDQMAAELFKLFSSIGATLWRHPTAIYSAGLHIEPNMVQLRRMGILCQAGPEAETLHASLNQVAGMLQALPIPIHVFRQGDMVGIAVGVEQEVQAMAGPEAGRPKPLAGNEAFRQAMGQVQKSPVAMVYIDTESVLKTIDIGVQNSGDEQAAALWPKVRDALGIGGLKRITMAWGFDGPDWSGQMFIAAPSPRVGLLSLLEAKPVSEQMLRAIPASATFASVGQLDLGKLLAEIRTAAGKVDPQAQKMFDQGMGIAQMALVMNVQKDFLETLGSEWAVYIDPEAAGSGLLGLTFVNRLAKPAEAQKALNKLTFFLDNTINGQLQREKLRIGFEQVKVGELDVHYVAMPVVSPSWTIKEGVLYAGLYPQVVAGAIGPRKGSILEHPGYQAMRKRLDVPNATGVMFADLPALAGEGYQITLMLFQGLLGMADLVGVKTPPLVIPPLARLRPHLAPAGAATWVDDAGWHMKSISPFPGSQLLMSQGSMVMAAPALMAAFTFPQLAQARDRAERVKSAVNLRQIGQGVMLYANDHGGVYPPDLGSLLETGVEIDVFLSPSSGRQVPDMVLQGNDEQKAKWINGNSDYVYLGATVKPADNAETIVAYEKPDVHGGRGLNVLFNDGHVEWMNVGDAMQRIERQQGK